jgi:hypothetical protein
MSASAGRTLAACSSKKYWSKYWSNEIYGSGQGDALEYSITVRGLCVHEMVLQGEDMCQVRWSNDGQVLVK